MIARHSPAVAAAYLASGAWTGDTVDGLFRARAAIEPDLLALVDPPNLPELTGRTPRRLNWAELDRRVDALAATLLSRRIVAGDVVATQLPNSADLVVAFLATVRIGAVAMPLPVAFREHELTEMCARAGAKAMLTCTRIGDRHLAGAAKTVLDRVDSLATLGVFGPNAPESADSTESTDSLESADSTDSTGETDTTDASGGADARLLELDVVLDQIDDAAARAAVEAHLSTVDVDPADPITICWTSGTEAAPKGVPRCHGDWLAIADACREAGELSDADVMLNPFPMTNMAGIAGMFLPWLRVGGRLVLHHPFDPGVFLRQLATERITYTIAPPALLTMLLRDEKMLAATDISSLRALGSGSAPLAPSMVREWQERYGIGVTNFFGSNEGCCLLSSPAEIPDPEQRAKFFPRYGAPGARWRISAAAHTSVKLVDRRNGDVITAPGRPGELFLKGPTVFAGYLDELSDDPYDTDGYFATGDVFEYAGESGRLLRFMDRAKDIVIRGGVNIAPAELEGLLHGHPAVADVAIIGVPDETLGERVCAVVVPAAEGPKPTLAELVEFLRGTEIASYKLPERLEFTDLLPRNPVGKIVKRLVRMRLDARA